MKFHPSLIHCSFHDNVVYTRYFLFALCNLQNLSSGLGRVSKMMCACTVGGRNLLFKMQKPEKSFASFFVEVDVFFQQYLSESKFLQVAFGWLNPGFAFAFA